MIIEAQPRAFQARPSARPARTGAPAAAEPRRRGRTALAVACWTYLALIIADWLVMRQAGDRWWVATVLLLAPRWPLALPLLLLVPLVVLGRRWRSAAALGLAALVLAGPILGVRASFSRIGANRGDVRLMTCNVHRQQLDPHDLAAYIAKVHPDVMALQGWSDVNQAALFTEDGWDVRREGELLIASRWPIESVTNLPISDGGDTPKEERGVATLARLRGPAGPVNVVSLHLASPHAGLNALWNGEGARLAANVERRWRESARLREQLASVQGPLLMAGDFNTTDDSPIFREHWPDFTDAFDASGWGLGYTYWNDHTQIRIDHVIGGTEWRFARCWVGPDVGSPHRPLVADAKLR
jgi:vancomycin resistance protein VanJ